MAATPDQIQKISKLASSAPKNENGLVEIHLTNPEILEYSKIDGKVKKLEKSKTSIADNLRDLGEAALSAFNETYKDGVRTVVLIDDTDKAAVTCTVKDQYSIDEKLVQQAEMYLPAAEFSKVFVKETTTRLKADAVSILTEMVKKAFGESAVDACMETVTTYKVTPIFERAVSSLKSDDQKLVRNAAKRYAPTLKPVSVDED